MPLRARLAETPWITDAYALTGEHDHVFKVVALGMNEPFHFVTYFLPAQETVEIVRTEFVPELIMEAGQVPTGVATPGNP